jgi:hypothetical protein
MNAARSFQYPAVFLLPLALLAGTVFFARLFTRDAGPPADRRASPTRESKGMR